MNDRDDHIMPGAAARAQAIRSIDPYIRQAKAELQSVEDCLSFEDLHRFSAHLNLLEDALQSARTIYEAYRSISSL